MRSSIECASLEFGKCCTQCRYLAAEGVSRSGWLQPGFVIEIALEYICFGPVSRARAYRLLIDVHNGTTVVNRLPITDLTPAARPAFASPPGCFLQQ